MSIISKSIEKLRRASGKQLFVIFALFLTISLGGLVAGSSFSSSNKAGAECIGDPSPNSIIQCGASNRADLIAKVRANPQLQAIYSHFNLTPTDYDRFINSGVQGYAYASDNTIKVNGRVVATNAWSIGRWQSAQGSSPMSVPIPGAGQFWGNYNNKAFKTPTTVIPVDVLLRADGTLQFAVMTRDCGNPATGTPTPPPTPPKPVYACNGLVATAGMYDQRGRQMYTFKVTGSATNANIIRYNINYGDGTSESSTGNFSHYYAVGNWNAQATVTVQTNTGDVVTTPVNPYCSKPITVKPTTLACTNLKAINPEVNNDNGATTYTLVATASTQNATIDNYVFNFGDKSKEVTVKSSDATARTKHTFAAGSKWTARVTVNGKNIAGQAISSTSADCQTSVTVGQPNPNITLTKTVDNVKEKQVNINQNFTYQLVIKNIGKLNLKNVVITDAAPAGVTLLSTDLGTISGNNLSYTVPSLNIGQTVTINITAVVKEYVAGSLVNTACVNAPEVNPKNPDQPDVCDTATVTVPPVTPTELVHTGAGSVVGLFAASAIAGMIGYRFVLGRRLNRN